MTQEPEQPGNWLERRIEALDALFRRFGRDGFKDQPLADVHLLLASKEMQFRDMPKGRDLSEQAKSVNRGLELEIGEIKSYLRGQVAGLSLADLRSYRQPDRPQQQQQFKHKDRGGHER